MRVAALVISHFLLSDSIFAVSDLLDVSQSSNFLVFLVLFVFRIAYQFMKHVFDEIVGHIKPGTVAISEMKCVTFSDHGI
jgi:hypothetical protein